MHLNWFSPLPPALTGIAHFTESILPELAQSAQLTLWTPDKHFDPRLAQFGVVRSLSGIAKADLEAADINVFNIGNDRAHHKKILRLALSNSGVIVLHDLFLPSLIRRQDRKSAPPNAADFLWFTQRLVSRALAVIVHAHFGLKVLGETNQIMIRVQPLPFRASIPPASHARSAGSNKRLIIFGFLGSNRRIESVLRALHSCERKNALHLDIFGRLSKPITFQRMVKKLRLQDRVTFHGYVSEAKLERTLSEADLAINLRYPTMGEASGSQLQIWNHALPSLVTPVGWYKDLPKETVAYVDPGNEIADLHFHFEKLQSDPGFYRQMGEKGRAALIAHHQPKDYADAIVALCKRAMESRPTFVK